MKNKFFLLYPQQRQKETNSRKDSWNVRKSLKNKKCVIFDSLEPWDLWPRIFQNNQEEIHVIVLI